MTQTISQEAKDEAAVILQQFVQKWTANHEHLEYDDQDLDGIEVRAALEAFVGSL